MLFLVSLSVCLLGVCGWREWSVCVMCVLIVCFAIVGVGVFLSL